MNLSGNILWINLIAPQDLRTNKNIHNEEENIYRKVFWYFCHVWILCGITLGILNIVFQKYDAYTSIYLGIICSCYTYYDNKQNPVSKRTNAYISSLQGYVAGIGFLLYGLLSL